MSVVWERGWRRRWAEARDGGRATAGRRSGARRRTGVSLTKRTMRTSPARLPTLIWSPITSESSTAGTSSAKRYTSAVPMRTPPGFSVVSERPYTTMPPALPTDPVTSTRSPWYL